MSELWETRRSARRAWWIILGIAIAHCRSAGPASVSAGAEEAWAKDAKALLASPRPKTASDLFLRDIAVSGALARVYDGVKDAPTGQRAAPLVTSLISEFSAIIYLMLQRPLRERVDAQAEHGAQQRESLMAMARAQGRAGLVASARASMISAFQRVKGDPGLKNDNGPRHPNGIGVLTDCSEEVQRGEGTGHSCAQVLQDRRCRDAFSGRPDLRGADVQRHLAIECTGYCGEIAEHPLPALCVAAPGSVGDEVLREQSVQLLTSILVLEFGRDSYEPAKQLVEVLHGILSPAGADAP